MSASIYFINPAADFPTYFNAENYAARGFRRATQMADLAIPTLAAMTPSDFHVSMCDENIEDVDYDHDAQYVGITGKVTQFARMIKIANEFKKRGKVVVMGGPYASLVSEAVRPHCDILVRGEIEEIAPQIFSDLRSGRWKDEYVGGKPSLATSPVPRWDGYPNDRAVMGTLQTSRGCPFECEFCDVIQYAGRKQRHKEPAQVLRELEVLYSHGHRNVFLADDNFTVYRARARELLLALRDWNRRQENGKVAFLTQLSVDAARDDDLLTLCAEAGLITVFIGIETPNPASLKEAKKRQNLHLDLVEQVHSFLDHGIQVVGGMIVGFDSDGPDIFRQQYDFAMASGIPIFSLGALVAPAATPLHARMKREGRLKEGGSEVAAVPWTTNIVHPTMGEEQLIGGLRWLANNLYSPESMGERLIRFIEKLGKRRDPKRGEPMRPGNVRSVDHDSMAVLAQVRDLGPAENTMWLRVMRAAAKKPDATAFVLAALVQYMQIRYMYDLGRFWDAQPSAPATPPAPLRSTKSLPVIA
jgi:radical SAM superfamily enzyme YgiQ (UPF0313 family)